MTKSYPMTEGYDMMKHLLQSDVMEVLEKGVDFYQ